MCTIISQERFKYSVHNPRRREAPDVQSRLVLLFLLFFFLVFPALFLTLHLYIFIYIYIRLRFNYKVRYVSGSPGIVLHTISRDWRITTAKCGRRACLRRSRGDFRFVTHVSFACSRKRFFVALLSLFLCVRFP